MADKKLTVEEFEKANGFIADNRKEYPLDKKLTEAELWDLVRLPNSPFIGINYEDRIKFLEDNDYEVNHENMINSDLSVRES